ncbi:MAG: DUF4445 domain-containing protein [Clostridia bacterium]|nr:DUF4445 domain-containing protein [Clostridia bacterium]
MITITVNGTEYRAEPGICLGAFAAEKAGVPMVCGGRGRCGKCKGTVKGDVSAVTERELEILSPDEMDSGIRLLCRTYALGDCSVDIGSPLTSQIRSDGELPDHEHAPAFRTYGAAIDLGTTTIAARLYYKDGTKVAERSLMNPQRSFGGDVVTRMESALSGNASALASSARDAICTLLSEMASDAGIQTDMIDGAVITGNTVMLHLLTETDVRPLTHAPFEAERLFGETVSASDAGLSVLSPDTPVYLPPCVGAFVGADTVSSVAASGLTDKDGVFLLTDIGTNGETVLKHGSGLIACSTAAGPAFEGAGISMGMGGASGAIDRVNVLLDGSLDYHVIGETKPAGICGSGLVDALAAMLDAGLMDETGFLNESPVHITPAVMITQKDVRAAQLAKSAIHAGIRTLLQTAGLECRDVDILYIAGGFGSYIDIVNAGKIGLVPDELVQRVCVLGNAALTGASLLLLSLPERKRFETESKRIGLVSLASNPVFTDEYMERMMF